MKNTQKILAILLVSIFLFGLWSPAYATEASGAKLTMEVPQSSHRVGDIVKVVICADKDFTTRGSGMTLYYDAEKLELDLEGSLAVSPFRIDPVTVNGKTALRISFLPGLDAVMFSADQPLAELSFRALAATEQTMISMGAAYLYDASLNEIALERPETVELTIEPSEGCMPVTGIRLDRTEQTLNVGEMVTLNTVVEPLDASNSTVLWTSSDEKIAIVSNGVVKALMEGSATITATTQDGGFAASCIVTVTSPVAGYTVELPTDVTAVIGGTVLVPVTVGNTDSETGYNAFDIRFIYDPEVLELISTTLPGVTVTVDQGEIHVLGYGEDRNAGSVPFVLEFKALKMETTEVQITTARIDNSQNAVDHNAPLASIADDRMTVAVTGYPVTLPAGFTGAGDAVPNTDYIFTEPDDYYLYTVTATVGGNEVTVTKNGDGSYTIPAEYITGEIVVFAEKTGKSFKVTLGSDMTGAATAQYGTDYVATIDRDESYRYTVTVTIGGKDYTGYAASGKTYTIPCEDITGEIVFTVQKELIVPVNPPGPTEQTKPTDPTETTKPVTYHSVTFAGSGAGAAQGNAISITNGGTYTLILNKQAGYNYQVSYKLGDKAEVAVSPNANGTYTIANVSAALEIIVEKSLAIDVSVQEYMTLDGKTMFLILADAALSNGSVFTYDGNVMYDCEAYDAWAYLVITDQELDLNQVRSQVKISPQTDRAIMYSGDVDGNGSVDMNDAQLIQDLYQAKYDTFDTVTMMKYLRADVNGDRKVDIRDAAWVTWKILGK